jgi:hypothetical protein
VAKTSSAYVPSAGTLAKEALFVAAYSQHKNGTKAVLEAGYTGKHPRRTASMLLARPRVREALNAKVGAAVAEFNMSASRIKRELYSIATVDPLEAFDDAGHPLPLKRIPPHVRAAIKSLRVETLPSGASRCAVEFWSKTEALHVAAKHLALLAPKEVSVTVRFPHAHLSDAELKQKLLDSANTIEAT